MRRIIYFRNDRNLLCSNVLKNQSQTFVFRMEPKQVDFERPGHLVFHTSSKTQHPERYVLSIVRDLAIGQTETQAAIERHFFARDWKLDSFSFFVHEKKYWRAGAHPPTGTHRVPPGGILRERNLRSRKQIEFRQ